MLFHKKVRPKILRVISIILIWAFVLPDLAISASIYADRSALAPPLVTDPPCRIVKLPNGQWDVITYDRAGISWFNETFKSIKDSALREEFHKKWEFVHSGFLIAQALKLQISKYTLSDLLGRAAKGMPHQGMGFGGMEAISDNGKITAFSLPIISGDGSKLRYNLVYSLERSENAEMVIQLDSETNIYVSIESEGVAVKAGELYSVPELSRAEQWEVLGKIFVHTDGIGIASTIVTLQRHGILSLLKQNETITMQDILKTRGGSNRGYLHVAMRLLASQGWITRYGPSAEDTMQFALTQKGRIAIELAPAYEKVIDFVPVAIELKKYLFDKSRAPPAKALELYKKLIELSKREWDLAKETDPNCQVVRQEIINHLDGMIIGPTMARLKERGVFDLFKNKNSVIMKEILEAMLANEVWLSAAFDLLSNQGWAARERDCITLTDKGIFAASRALSYGVPVSYLPTLVRTDDLLFGDANVLWERDALGNETHVDRVLNVKGSGEAHTTYFKKVDEIIIEIFNRPIDEQPLYIIDMGCGDGTLLKHLYEVVMQKTKRGEWMREHPNNPKYKLLVIGADFNEAAQRATEKTLRDANIPHKVLFGNINDPDSFAVKLKEQGLDIKEGLHVRSFLDHNRPYIRPEKIEKGRISGSTGAFACHGRAIPNDEFEQNQVDHFRRWVPYIQKHGLLLLELHTIPPELASENIGRTLATAYDATHGYTDQLTVELDVFLKTAKEAGLIADERWQTRIPKSDMATVSINFFTMDKAAGEKAVIAKKLERLRILGAGQIAEAIRTSPDKYSFILDDPLLNDDTFWNDPKRAHEIIKSGKPLEEIFGVDTTDIRSSDMVTYFRNLKRYIPSIVDITAKLFSSQKYAGAKFIYLGRATDLLYWTSKYLLGDAGRKRSILMDFSYFGFNCLDIADSNKEAFERYLEGLGLRKNEKIVIVDEFSVTSPTDLRIAQSFEFMEAIEKHDALNELRTTFASKVAGLFASIGYTDVEGVDMSKDFANPHSNKSSERDAYAAMDWLGDDYNSGRMFEVRIENGQWEYTYHDLAISNVLHVNKNGEYLGWLNRRYLYEYILANKIELDGKVQEVRKTQSIQEEPSLIDFASFTPERMKELYDEAKDECEKAIKAIIKKKRTFNNTIKAFENARGEFNKAIGPISTLARVSPIEAVRKEAGRIIVASGVYLMTMDMNEELFEAVKEYADSKDVKTLKGEDKKLLEDILDDFKQNGMGLEEEKKQELRRIKVEYMEKAEVFEQNLQEAEEKIIASEEELEGLPREYIDKLQIADGGLRCLQIDYTTYEFVMEKAKSEGLRRRYENAFQALAIQENLPLFEKMIKLRKRMAQLLGYSSYAEYAFKDRMAKTSDAVFAFLEEMREPLLGKNKKIMERLLKLKKRDNPRADKIYTWDVKYYFNQLKKEYFNPEEIPRYFPVESVVNNALKIFEEFLELEFIELKDAPRWHESVRVFEVRRKVNGQSVGQFHLDLFQRPGKFQYKAMACSIIEGRRLADGTYQRPIAAIVANLPENFPHWDIEVFFHEFGHLMHGILTQARYSRFAGTNVKIDFAEVMSDLFQELAWQPQVLERLSEGRIPKETVEKMIKFRKFTTPNYALGTIARSLFDMKCHTEEVKDVELLIRECFAKCGIDLSENEHYFNSAATSHIVGGYAAGYYGYPWAERYMRDILSRFQKEGIANPAVWRDLINKILIWGSSMPEIEQIEGFLGRKPNNKAFLRFHGIDLEEGILTPETERINSIRFTDEIKMIQAKEEKALSFIAVGTDWMKGYRKEKALEYNILNPYISAIKRYCEEHNIQFIVNNDEAIVDSVAKIKETSPNARGIVLASEETIKNLANDKNLFLASVNGENIDVNNYIRLVEMLRVMIGVFRSGPITAKDIEAIQKEHPQLGITFVNGRLIFIPHAEPVNYEDINIKALYTAQVSA